MVAAKFQIRRKCRICGKEFMAKTIESWNCSPQCSRIAYKRRKDEEARNKKLDEIVKHLDIPTSLQEFGVPAADLDGLVEAGMQVKRLLVNNMREITPEDARKIYQQVL